MDANKRVPPRGRGALENPSGRFESVHRLRDEYVQDRPRELLDGDLEIEPLPRTQVLEDHPRSALTQNDSPDLPFNYSLNPYRGCEHGCIYCYARPTHEYLGLSAGIDFESKIFIKNDLPELLRKELLSKSWKPETINLSGVTDCYQPIEKKYELTRKCIEVLAEFRNPFTIITKNYLVVRDLDIFKQMAELDGVSVFISITSLDSELISKMEPRTSRPAQRLRAIETLANAGIPVGVMVAPVLPGLTDHEMPSILKAAKEAGASMAGYTLLRLPYGLKSLFSDWLGAHFPERKMKVLHRIESLRDGKLDDSSFTSRMRGEGVFAEHLQNIFRIYTQKYELNSRNFKLSSEHFRRIENAGQGELF